MEHDLEVNPELLAHLIEDFEDEETARLCLFHIINAVEEAEDYWIFRKWVWFAYGALMTIAVVMAATHFKGG